MKTYEVTFKRELELKFTVEAKNEDAAESAAEVELAKTKLPEWEEIDTNIENIQEIDSYDDEDSDE